MNKQLEKFSSRSLQLLRNIPPIYARSDLECRTRDHESQRIEENEIIISRLKINEFLF